MSGIRKVRNIKIEKLYQKITEDMQELGKRMTKDDVRNEINAIRTTL